MKLSKPAIAVSAVVIFSLTILFSCKKINESTTLGGDLIPDVDNVTTFDTTLSVFAFNDSFTSANDSTRVTAFTGFISSASQFYLGTLNDPIFGKTDSRVYFQVGPAAYNVRPFRTSPDSLNIDSVVLILDYKSLYGDSIAPETIKVFEVAANPEFRFDSAYRLRRTPFSTGAELGSRTFQPLVLNDSILAFKDTTANQLRIRLDDAFGQRLLDYDTVASAGHIAAYVSDSTFKLAFPGFALQATSGNALLGIDLNGTNTKLAIYYKDDNNGAAVQDTAVTYFAFKTSSAAANFVGRDYSGTTMAASFNGTTLPDDDLVYIQSTPGTYATLRIPGLVGLSNRTIHKADLIMEEVYDVSDAIFTPPTYLYIDAFDPAVPKNVTVPYDVVSDGTSYNYNAFGVFPINGTDPFGNSINTWRFNLSRYVQNVLNGNQVLRDLRLYSPLYVTTQYKPTATATPFNDPNSINSTLSTFARGRVRLGGGTHPTQKMRLRLVYSKI